MQIDFHHAVTYVVARLTGFNHGEATTIAHSAQYVDDAVNEGTVSFQNKAMYSHICSAHKMLDYRNFEALANHRAWLPFHFLPSNAGKPAGENPKGGFAQKIICRPDRPEKPNYVARDMIKDCIEEQDRPFGLHRLGITMHIYADTWAHQGFSGIISETNKAGHIMVNGDLKPDSHFTDKQENFFGNLIDKTKNALVDDLLPLGHGAVLSYPDRPYLEWTYRNWQGKTVVRNNPADFLQACERMYQAMRQYQLRDGEAEVDGLPEADREILGDMLKNIDDDDSDSRHEKWLKAMREGRFSFGPVTLQYIPKGKGSWKYTALGTKSWIANPDEKYPYRKSFLSSNWKLFHDALQSHRFRMLHLILPRYGICAA